MVSKEIAMPTMTNEKLIYNRTYKFQFESNMLSTFNTEIVGFLTTADGRIGAYENGNAESFRMRLPVDG
jgi:hypothetical protein